MVDVEQTNIGAHAILITKDGTIVLQQRDSKPGIVNPGLISVWGGTINLNETQIQGLKRELLEELEINTDNYKVEKLGVFYKTKELDGIDYVANIFVIKEIDPNRVTVREGKDFVCDDLENLLKNTRLTRITRLALEQYQALKTS